MLTAQEEDVILQCAQVWRTRGALPNMPVATPHGSFWPSHTQRDGSSGTCEPEDGSETPQLMGC